MDTSYGSAGTPSTVTENEDFGLHRGDVGTHWQTQRTAGNHEWNRFLITIFPFGLHGEGMGTSHGSAGINQGTQ